MELDRSEYKDIMLDLETFGTGQNALVVSIGAVLFDRSTATLGPGFYANLNLQQMIDAGFRIDASTLEFWLKQGDAARDKLFTNPLDVFTTLMGFAQFVTDDNEGGVCRETRVWGNGSRFDNALLGNVYQRLGLVEPWGFFNDRCYRTFKNENDPEKRLLPNNVGTAHNALDDAIFQARHLMNIDAGKRLDWPEYEAAYIGHRRVDDEEEL